MMIRVLLFLILASCALPLSAAVYRLESLGNGFSDPIDNSALKGGSWALGLDGAFGGATVSLEWRASPSMTWVPLTACSGLTAPTMCLFTIGQGWVRLHVQGGTAPSIHASVSRVGSTFLAFSAAPPSGAPPSGSANEIDVDGDGVPEVFVSAREVVFDPDETGLPETSLARIVSDGSLSVPSARHISWGVGTTRIRGENGLGGFRFIVNDATLFSAGFNLIDVGAGGGPRLLTDCNGQVCITRSADPDTGVGFEGEGIVNLYSNGSPFLTISPVLATYAGPTRLTPLGAAPFVCDATVNGSEFHHTNGARCVCDGAAWVNALPSGSCV